MARKKKFFGGQVSGKSFSQMLGLFFILGAVVTLASFFHQFPGLSDVLLLSDVNFQLHKQLGWFALLLPIILLMVATHFFGKKRKRLIRPHTTIGSTLMYLTLIMLFQSGELGTLLMTRAKVDFTPVWSYVLLIFVFVIGVVLFLDTSLDVVIEFIGVLARAVWIFFARHVFGGLFSSETSKKGKEKTDDKKGEKDFIQDKKSVFGTMFASKEKPKEVAAQPQGAAGNHNEMAVRPLPATGSTWIYPPISILQEISQQAADRGDVQANADTIEKTLDSFGIRARVAEVNNGPTVTQYALEITMGTKLSKITALGNDLALALAAPSGQVRIEAPIPGRSMVGIEVPNIRAEIVTLRRVLTSNAFKNSNDALLVPLGLDVTGEVQGYSISRMPHTLIAGTTGSGKSVVLNAWITSMLFRAKPEELRFIMVDPKRVELSVYNGIPHLMTEVITEPDKIISALRWTVAEMETRYKEFAKVGVRNLEGYNAIEGVVKKPYLIFIIDELADLMMFAPGDAEDLITRIAQMARATGIHLILATQRPSVDVITGLMKANIPTRMAFNVSSLVDSRVIIDTPGAEKLMGKGDMLFLPPDQAKPRRMQGPLVTEKEIHELVSFLKSQAPPVHYTEEITSQETQAMVSGRGGSGGQVQNGDPLLNQAIEIIMQTDKASASLLQRKLSIGYARAARVLDQLEEAGYVGQADGSKPREVIHRPQAEVAQAEME